MRGCGTTSDLSNNPKLVTLESNSFVDLPQLVEITYVVRRELACA